MIPASCNVSTIGIWTPIPTTRSATTCGCTCPSMRRCRWRAPLPIFSACQYRRAAPPDPATPGPSAGSPGAAAAWVVRRGFPSSGGRGHSARAAARGGLPAADRAGAHSASDGSGASHARPPVQPPRAHPCRARSAYVDPINLAQIELRRRLRQRPDPQVRRRCCRRSTASRGE